LPHCLNKLKVRHENVTGCGGGIVCILDGSIEDLGREVVCGYISCESIGRLLGLIPCGEVDGGGNVATCNWVLRL
jgi:hypothetical protein